MKHALLLLAALAVRCEAAPVAAAQCASYASELSTMVSVDRSMRSRWDMQKLYGATESNTPRFIEQTNLIDRKNTERFKGLVRACGWPTRALHGQSAVDDSWLIAQHADHDRAFQRAFLAHVRGEVEAGTGSPVQLAYLSDRLDSADGKPQRYGTQLVQKGPCEFEFASLDDRDMVEARRKALGWPSLDEYKVIVHENVLPAACSTSK